MTDDHDGGGSGLGKAHQLRRALTQLRDSTRGSRHRGRLHRLNGVDHQQAGLAFAGQPNDARQVTLGDTTQAGGGQAEALGAQPDLGNRLLTTGVEHPTYARHVCGNLEEKCRLADAGIASQQRDRTGYDAAAKNTIQFLLDRKSVV